MYVLKYTMDGQVWPDGDLAYHEEITAPTLLIHGQQDSLVPIEEALLMEAVIKSTVIE